MTLQISPEEKVKAVNLMGDDESELPHRKQVRSKSVRSVEYLVVQIHVGNILPSLHRRLLGLAVQQFSPPDNVKYPMLEQVFHKYLPGAEFINTLPPFCEPEGPPEPEMVGSTITEAVVSDTPGESLGLDAGIVTREATACVEEVLETTSSEVVQ